MKIEKPPVLSVEQVEDWMRQKGIDLNTYTYQHSREAQRDADVAYYEPIIDKIIKDDATRCAGYLDLAKAEVAREIFGEIEKILEPTFRKETPLPIPNFYIRETKLQSLKSKYVEGVTDKLPSGN